MAAGSNHFKCDNSGFGLIVLAVILMVAGVLLITFLPTKSEKIIPQIKKTNQQIAQVTDSLRKFYSDKGTLPCPARFDYKTDNSNFGVATCGICAAGEQYCNGNTEIGAVPTRTLGLPDSAAFDQWGRHLTYVMNTTNDPAGLQVKDLSGNIIPSVMSLVISHGLDGKGAFMANGLPGADGCSLSGAGTTSSELENCNYLLSATAADTNFISDGWSSLTATYFDDIVGKVNKCPADIGGCVVWLDATDTNSVIMDGSNNVSIWKDKSGHGNDATALSPRMPVWTASGISGKGSMVFDGTGKYFNLPATVMSHLADFTYIFVYKQTATVGWERVFDYGNATNQAGFFTVNVGGSGGYPRYAINICCGEQQLSSSSNSLTNGDKHIITTLWSSTRGNMYQDGVNVSSVYGGPFYINTQIPHTYHYIGKSSYSDPYLNGKLAEIIIYPKYLKYTDQRQIECYLGTKYNITVPGCNSPAGVYGANLWLDASQVSYPATNPANGTSITSWNDKSLSGTSMNLHTKSDYPTLVSSEPTLNHLPVLNFTYSQGLHTPALNLVWNEWTVIYLAREIGGGHNARMLQGALSGENWLLGAWNGYLNEAYYNGWVANSATSVDTSWRIYEGAVDGTQGYFYSNGSLLAANTGGMAAPLGLGLNDYTCCDEPTDMQVAELLAYPTPLAEKERKKVECYIANKYGICSSLPGGGASYCNNITAPTNYCGAALP